MREILNYILYFFIYSFLGWCIESIYCSIWDKKVVNRGFLNGPLCPIYGFGSVLVIFTLYRFKGNAILIFFMGAILTSIIEYITSYFMEVCFHAKWWDYSNKKYNINGRVCLLNSTLFGVLSFVLIELIHSNIEKIVSHLSMRFISIFITCLCIILVTDLITTLYSVIKMNLNLEELEKIMGDMGKLNICLNDVESKDISELFANYRKKELRTISKKKLNEIKEKLEAINSKSILQKRIFHAFPNIKHNKYHEQLKYYKKLLKSKR